MHFKAEQERRAACIICPQKYRKSKSCKRERCSCSIKYQNSLRKSKKFRKEILAICHWLYDDTLRYFKIKE